MQGVAEGRHGVGDSELDLDWRGGVLGEVLFVDGREEGVVDVRREGLEETEGGGERCVDAGEDAGHVEVAVDFKESLAELHYGGLVAECRD